ncbi:MAG: hypothetical protein MUF81_21090, partial [Verrucomicrobia bacterium]|nr:hypothetical protein [Verrucomicrobiota bacterium]
MAQKDEEPKDYNIWLDSVGLVQTNISLFELLEVDKEEAAKLRTLKGSTPMKLVMQATTRSAFRDAVEGGKWRVDPRLPGVLADAIAEYNAGVEETRSRIEKAFRLSETEPAPWPLEASLWLFQNALYEVLDDCP